MGSLPHGDLQDSPVEVVARSRSLEADGDRVRMQSAVGCVVDALLGELLAQGFGLDGVTRIWFFSRVNVEAEVDVFVGRGCGEIVFDDRSSGAEYQALV